MQIPKIDPLMGIMYGLKAFVAAVLGGIGSIPGAMLGGLLIGISETMVVGYLSSTYRDAVAFGDPDPDPDPPAARASSAAVQKEKV